MRWPKSIWARMSIRTVSRARFGSFIKSSPTTLPRQCDLSRIQPGRLDAPSYRAMRCVRLRIVPGPRRLPRLTTRSARLILSYMVNYQVRLDRTSMALVDPTRRAILAQLERRDDQRHESTVQPYLIVHHVGKY